MFLNMPKALELPDWDAARNSHVGTLLRRSQQDLVQPGHHLHLEHPLGFKRSQLAGLLAAAGFFIGAAAQPAGFFIRTFKLARA